MGFMNYNSAKRLYTAKARITYNENQDDIL